MGAGFAKNHHNKTTNRTILSTIMTPITLNKVELKAVVILKWLRCPRMACPTTATFSNKIKTLAIVPRLDRARIGTSTQFSNQPRVHK